MKLIEEVMSQNEKVPLLLQILEPTPKSSKNFLTTLEKDDPPASPPHLCRPLCHPCGSASGDCVDCHSFLVG